MSTLALVTGGTRGIGLETVRQLASGGMRVMLGARTMADGNARVTALRAEGLDVEAIHIDLCDPATHAHAAAVLARRFGRLDVLINNAGILFADTDGVPGDAEVTSVRSVFETNFFGPLMVTQALLPLIRQSPRGRIVFVSSSLGSLARNADPNDIPPDQKWIGYAASKASVNMLMVQLAGELRGTTIKVNAVCPGFVKTDMNAGYGDLTVQEGAIASVRYATLDDNGPTGGFFNAEGPIAW